MPKRNPWIYVPTLYFAEGLPFTIVMMMSSVYLKDLGASNILIGLTGALQFPWTLKFIWAPLVDFFGKKKYWIVIAQMVLAVLLGVLALTVIAPNPTNFSIDMQLVDFFNPTKEPMHVLVPSEIAGPICTGVIVMALTAFASATHDASIDGYYLEALDKDEQALFVGVRNTAFRMSMIFGSGAMVTMAGLLTAQMGKQNAWMASFALLSLVMLVLFGIHTWYLPDTSKVAKEETTVSEQASSHQDRNYFRAIFSYFDQPRSLVIVAYILLFRLGDAMVMKMITPFLQDPLDKGGMGLSVAQIGMIYGTVGVCFLLLGGIAGGYLVSKQGLKRWFWPATLLMNSTILLYWLLATFRPESIVWVYVVNSLEQFGYGFGMAAYTVFLLSTVKQEYKAAHYAVATALMALGLMGPNMASGFVSEAYGYSKFFLISFFLTVPGMITILFLPIWRKESNQTAVS